MKAFLTELCQRDSSLFVFGGICFAAAAAFLVASRYSDVQVMETHAWYKPAKFVLSIGIYTWTMVWFLYYLGS